MVRAHILKLVALAGLLTSAFSMNALAQDWVIAKSTGQVWVASPRAQAVALTREVPLLPGDQVQTGPNGRVLLLRGDERILVAPNSVISLPEKSAATGMTTILQRAGSITVEAEKKDHQHFEVLTPYLAAVVKGTQFTVQVDQGSAEVRVSTGKVEVADSKSGLIALVQPGQWAKTTSAGLKVQGTGVMEPMRQGLPKATGVTPVPALKGGLTQPLRGNFASVSAVKMPGAAAPQNGIRITRAIGAVSLDASTATAGLVRSDGPQGSAARSNAGTIWNSGNAGAGSSSTASNNSSSNSSNNSSNGNGAGLSSNSVASVGNPAAAANGVGASAGNAGNNGNAFGLVNGGLGAAVNGNANPNALLHGKKK